MQSVRMYTGDDGKTHFEDLDFQFDAVTEVNRTSIENASGIQFVYQPTGFVISMHPAPRRQYVITIQGQAEIQLGDGTTRVFGPGDLVLAEDITGEGHITRIIGDVPRISAQISVPE